jgi:hypothetical protein
MPRYRLVRKLVTAFSLGFCFATPTLLQAQNQEPASASQSATEIINFLLLNQAVPTEDFERDRAAAETTSQTIVNALLVNLGSVPLASSSSGFIYRFNDQLGTVERASDTFGPFFVERAFVPGVGHPSFGVAATTTSFDELDGRPLRDGTLVTTANQFRDESAPFDTDSLTLRIRTSGVTLFGSVPVTDRLEIGAALPILSLSIEGQRINVYRGSTFAQAIATATASGVGDAAIRGKFLIASSGAAGVAASAELRLPTGDSDNLLGAGSAGWRFGGLFSYEPARFAVHVNVGVAGGGVSDEVTFAAAALGSPSPRLTVSGELLVRKVDELRTTDLVAAPHPTIDGVDTYRLVGGDGGNATVQVVGGFKWNVGGTAVLGAHIRKALTSTGLTAPLTPTVTFEYAF